LAGCYTPSAFTGAPCDLSIDNCPGSQVCTAQAGGSFCTAGPTIDASSGGLDGRPDASGMADLDGDDVADLDDNCPAKANAGQSNEDGDAFGDGCDPCPPFVDGATPLDADGDGVGDACDPAPTVPGDQIRQR